MKTFKIFVASSNELKNERQELAKLANSLNNVLEPLNTHVIMVEWEDLDASMGVAHKQEEYNTKLRECEMCIVLYWSKFGIWTKQELDIAYSELRAGNNPKKLYVYFKNGGDKAPTPELTEFRESFDKNYGHFPSDFENFDTLKAHFLLQFMEYQNELLQDSKIVEVKDGKVLVGGKEYVDLANVPFAGNNEEYNRLKEDICELEEDLEDMDPENPRYERKSKRLTELRESLKEKEDALWNSAISITKLRNQKSSERLQRAIVAFEQGDDKGANAILKEEDIYCDAQHNISLIKLGEEGKEGLKGNIEQLLLKIELLRPDYDDDLKARNEAYNQITVLLNKVIEYSTILYGEYSEETLRFYFPKRISYFDQPKRELPFVEKALYIAKHLYTENSKDVICIYERLSRIHRSIGDTDSLKKDLEAIINLTGNVYGEQSTKYLDAVIDYAGVINWEGNEACNIWYEKAISICKALNDTKRLRDIYKSLLIRYIENKDWDNVEHIITNIKSTASSKEELLEILLHLQRTRVKQIEKSILTDALAIAEELNITEAKAEIYRRLARIYERRGDNETAVTYYKKIISTDVREKNTRYSYDYTKDAFEELANLYVQKGEYTLAIEYANQILDLVKDDGEDQDIADHYHLLSHIHRRAYKFDEAIEYKLKEIEIKETGVKSYRLRSSYNTLAKLYIRTDQADEALKIYKMLLEKKMATEHSIYQDMAYAYIEKGDIDIAEMYYRKSLDMLLEKKDLLIWADVSTREYNNYSIADAYCKLAWFYNYTQRYAEAQQALDLSFEAKSREWGRLRGRNIWQAIIHRGNKEYQKAIEIFEAEAEAKRMEVGDSQVEIARTLLEWGKADEALSTIQKVEDIKKTAEDYYHETLGLIYKAMNDLEKAKAEFEECLAIRKRTYAPRRAIRNAEELIESLTKN